MNGRDRIVNIFSVNQRSLSKKRFDHFSNYRGKNFKAFRIISQPTYHLEPLPSKNDSGKRITD